MEIIAVEVLDAEQEDTLQQKAEKVAKVLEQKFRQSAELAKETAHDPKRENQFYFASGASIVLGIATRLMYAVANNDGEVLDGIIDELEDAGK